MYSSEKIREWAQRAPKPENVESVCKEEASTVEAKAIKQPTKVLEISKAFIKDFCDRASTADRQWTLSTLARHMEAHQDGRYFAPFRTEFARRFFPELLGRKSKAGKVSLFDELLAIEEAKSA